MGTSIKLQGCATRQLSFISSFFIFYFTLILLSPGIFLLLLYRSALSLIFKVFYKSKYRLISGVDAVYAADRYANLPTITTFLYIKGECKIGKIRERISQACLFQNELGQRPYGLLLQSVVEKFGLVCWEDKIESVDFNHHIRFCPGACDPGKIYSEVEMLDAVAKCADSPWDENRPRWEILVTPKVSRDDYPQQIYYTLAVKIHHVYVDGVSFIQVLRNCVADNPPPFLIDPVNPPIPPVPFYKKVLLYLCVFFLGPNAILGMSGREQDPVFSEGTLTGEKFFGRLKSCIPFENVRRIRKVLNCTTQGLFHSCFTGALRKMAVKKGLQVANEIVAGVNFSLFPYPDDCPRNRAVFSMEPMEIGIDDPLARLHSVDSTMRNLGRQQYALISSRLLTKLVGLFPKRVLIASMESLKVPYILSNVPGLTQRGKVGGEEVEVFFGMPPLMNATRFSVGVGVYGEDLSVGFAIAKTKIVSNRNEVEELIREFEKELEFLEQSAKLEITVDLNEEFSC